MDQIKIDSFLDYQFISNPKWSSEGEWISYWVRNPDVQRDTYDRELRLLDRRGTCVPVRHDIPVTDCLWAPEEERLILCLAPEHGKTLPGRRPGRTLCPHVLPVLFPRRHVLPQETAFVPYHIAVIAPFLGDGY